MNVQISELLVRYMERLGIEVIFGMPGAHILPVYDGLYASDIKTVLVKHEQGASFMAGGYARASGKIGACITTAGPGATNLVTGIANAYVDKQPILIITGETSTHIFGKGGMQESSGEGGSVDQNALFAGITRYNKIVERGDYLANVLNRASQILLSDNPGPVLLSFPYNVQQERIDETVLDKVLTRRASRRDARESPLYNRLADLVQDAHNPVIVAGYGCMLANAGNVVADLSAMLNVPVATSLKGKGVVCEQGPLSLGSLGVTSDGSAYQYIVEHADLIVFLGAAFNERTSYLWDQGLLDNKRIAQIDNNPDQLEKVFRADVAICADLKDVLEDLRVRLKARGVTPKQIAPLPGRSDATATGSPVFDAKFALVKHFFEVLQTRFPDGIQVFDDNIIFAQNFFRVSSGNRFYPNSGISSLGHGIPAAIGARFAEDRPTFVIIGDGGFQMCCMELMTAVNYQIPLTVIMFNNATMGLVRKNQFQKYEQRYIDCDFVNPNYAALAASFGIAHYRADSEAALDAAFETADFVNGINLIELPIDKDAFPNYETNR